MTANCNKENKVSSPSSVKRPVLIVDDDPDMRGVLTQIVEHQGFPSLSFGNVTDCLNALKDTTFSLAFLDVMLPETTGFVLLKAIKEHPLHERTPVIMVTAEGADEQILDGYNRGADYYVTKPFNQKQVEYGMKLFLPK